MSPADGKGAGGADSGANSGANASAIPGANAGANSGANTGATIAVEVIVAAAPAQVLCVALNLPLGATVADALRAAGLRERLAPDVLDALAPSVWGRAAALDVPLRADDRVVLTRVLRVDPKEARRLRYRRDGLRQRVMPQQARQPRSPLRAG